MRIETVRGMRDFLPEDLAKRKYVEDKARECFRLYGYEEIETPVLESFDLITAKVGEEIRHRLYSFDDLGGRKVALRPEMTASVARLLAGKLRTAPKPLRLGYIANCFRYDNPQMGRYREFWQAGFELFGSAHAEADAEIIIMFHDLMRRLGFQKFTIKVGSVGVLRGLLGAGGVDEAGQATVMGFLDKGEKERALSFLREAGASGNCVEAVERLVELRGMDCRAVIEEGRKALSEKGNEAALASLDNLEGIVELCLEGGVSAEIMVDLGFARGLEYYTGMIFEVFVPDLGIALGGGGRYDGLVELFGGEATPAVGCSPGIDRIVLGMEKAGLFSGKLAPSAAVFVVSVGEGLSGKALEVASAIRKGGLAVQVEVSGRGLGAALSYAAARGFCFAAIVGAKEAVRDVVTLRDLRGKAQREVPVKNVAEEIKRELAKGANAGEG